MAELYSIPLEFNSKLLLEVIDGYNVVSNRFLVPNPRFINVIKRI